MARGADLKADLGAYLAEQEASLVALEERYLDEKVRLLNQIAAVKRALAAWDDRVDGLVATLRAAGIQL